jgi:hypothetical protein
MSWWELTRWTSNGCFNYNSWIFTTTNPAHVRLFELHKIICKVVSSAGVLCSATSQLHLIKYESRHLFVPESELEHATHCNAFDDDDAGLILRVINFDTWIILFSELFWHLGLEYPKSNNAVSFLQTLLEVFLDLWLELGWGVSHPTWKVLKMNPSPRFFVPYPQHLQNIFKI